MFLSGKGDATDKYIEVKNGGGDAKKWEGLVNRGQLAADRGRALLSHAPSLCPYIAHSRRRGTL